MYKLNLSDVSKMLTVDTIEREFRKKTKSKDNVKNISVTRAAPAGEGLIGAVYRIKVEGQHHTASFIGKGLVNDQLLRKSIICSEILFEREAFFYNKILPELVAVQKSLGAKENLQNNIPLCYDNYTDGNYDYILLEDLAEKGCKPLTNNPTKYELDTTLKTLAHFHAASIALKITKPTVFNEIADRLPETYYNSTNRGWYAAFLKNAIDIDIDVLTKFEDPSTSIYYKKFKDLLANDVYGQLIELTAHHDNLAVFNHGDAWIPNFLCSDELTVAIDFQGVRCTSIALDLSCFLIMCGSLIQNKDQFEEAVKVYYNFLKYYLRDMGIDENEVFSWSTLNEELMKYGKFGVIAALTSIPLLVSEKCDVLRKFEDKFSGCERIPLEDLWKLTPIKLDNHKKWLVNAIRIGVDVGLI